MHFDRFDICDAYYLFATAWHDGQYSEEYRIFYRLEKVRYRSAPNLSYKTLSENGREILYKLELAECEKHKITDWRPVLGKEKGEDLVQRS